MYQSLSWLLTVVLVLVLLAIFVYVAWHANEKAADTPVQQRSGLIPAVVFWGLVALFVPILGYTLSDLPYRSSVGQSGSPQVIDAVAYQWRWELSSTTAVVGRPVTFRVTGSDVNHGFGLYDPDLKLVAQTQAMPGYTNVLHHVFARPGTYKVLCMEYCGLAHHNMLAEIQVAAAK
jgi:cytochrome c oxidase subunit II